MVMADPSDLGHGKKRVTDGHGRSFGSWPWKKGCLMVMAKFRILAMAKRVPDGHC